jgi:hypothetical protein
MELNGGFIKLKAEVKDDLMHGVASSKRAVNLEVVRPSAAYVVSTLLPCTLHLRERLKLVEAFWLSGDRPCRRCYVY